MLTDYQMRMLDAIYGNTRIPLWVFSSQKNLCHTFAPDQAGSFLIPYMEKLALDLGDGELQICCYEKEYYFMFSFSSEEDTGFVLGGPMLLSGLYRPEDLKDLSFYGLTDLATLRKLVENLPIVSLPTFSSNLDLVMTALTGTRMSYETVCNFPFMSGSGSTGQKLFRAYFDELTDCSEHTPYSQEQAVLACVRDGDVKRLESTYRTLPKTLYGNMSHIPFKQLLYGCIANTTLVTRYAIEGSMDEEEAFHLSDSFIRQMDGAKNLYELNLLNEKMALEFTSRVAHARLHRSLGHSRAVHICRRYISTHFRESISLSTLAELTGLTPKYLSALFHKETGITIKACIEEKRIAEAKNLLIYSPYSYSRISQILGFHSQSYFIQIFSRNTGMTPHAFRDSLKP